MKSRILFLMASATVSAACCAPLGAAAAGVEAAASEAFEPDASAIATSDVYWDIYTMCADAWLANHPGYTEFNPYYVTPNYGNFFGSAHTDSEVASCIGVVPDGPDAYVYMWFSTKEDLWDGESPRFKYTTSTEIGDDGYYEDVEEEAVGELVSENGLESSSGSNWLAKYRLEGILSEGTGTKRISLISVSIPSKAEGYAPLREVDLSEDLQYVGSDADSSDFDYYHVQDDYVTVFRKKVSMLLEPVDGGGYDYYYWWRDDPTDVYSYNGDYDPNCVVQSYVSSDGQREELPGYANAYSKFNETTYCFFDISDYYVGGELQDLPVASVDSVMFSYNMLTYKYQSADFVRPWINWKTMPAACYAGLYDKPRSEEVFSNGASFFGEKTEMVEDKVETGNDVVNVVRESDGGVWSWLSKVLGTDGQETSQMPAIIDCTDEDYWYSNQFEGELSSFSQFVLANRWDYDYAFRVANTVRSGEINKDDNSGWNYRWNSVSTCHEVQDLAILRIRFRDLEQTSFDLKALDTTTSTESVYIPSTAGKSYTLNVVHSGSQGSSPWYEQLLNAAKVVAAVLGIGLIVYGLAKISGNRTTTNVNISSDSAKRR